MANTFKFGNGNWAVKDGYALAYNDENNNFKPLPFDFTRASSATRVNRQGLIETVGSGKPRIDFLNNTSGHLLLEPSRSNSILYSNGFDNSSWQKGGGGLAPAPTVSANQGISPDGLNNAYKIVFDLAGGTSSSDRSRLTQSVTGTSSTNYAFSFYAKAFSTSDVGKIVNFSVDNVDNENANFTLTSDWKRFTFLGISTGTNINQHIQLRGNLSTSDSVSMLLFGYQIEAGSYATSYIPTEGLSATRVAETANGAGNSTVFNDSEGVLFVEVAALANDGTTREMALSDGGASNRIELRYISSANVIQTVIRGAASTIVLSYTLTDATEFAKVAVKYKSGDYALWVSGVERATSTTTGTPTGLSEFAFDDGNGNFNIYAKIKQAKLYNTTLTDSELQQLTS